MGGEPHALCPEEGGAVILAQGAPSDGLPIFGEERDLREKNMTYEERQTLLFSHCRLISWLRGSSLGGSQARMREHRGSL